MKERIILALSILLLSLSSLLVLWQAYAVPTNQGQQLFFDDFTSSQLSENWNPMVLAGKDVAGGNLRLTPNGNLSQSGGWLGLVERSTTALQNPYNYGISAVMANATDPIVSSADTNKFIYMVWRILPFNLSQVGNNPSSNFAIRNAVVTFGLFAQNCPNVNNCQSGVGGFSHGIGFQLYETDSGNSIFAPAIRQQRETVGFTIMNPSYGIGSTVNCYYFNGNNANQLLGSAWNTDCTTPNRDIIYSNPTNPYDLNIPHIFTMEINLDGTGSGGGSNNSWIAFNMDGNAWYNVTDRACACIAQNSGAPIWRTLYPYITSVYCLGFQTDSCGNGAVPGQSLGTMVDYVAVYNYVPQTLPTGQAVPNPGISSQIGPQGLRSTFPNYLVALAYELGKGIPLGSPQFLMSQVQFGGFLLFLITIMVITVPGVILHVRNPMIYSFLAFIISIIYFGLGVLALWFFGSIVLLFLGIMVGTVPASLRHTGGGGEVE